MKNTRTSRLFAGFATAIILVLVVGTSSYLTLTHQASQQQWVQRTYQIMNQVSYIQNLMVDMETGRRGFRCTNDRQFLVPYFTSQPKMAGAVDDLKKIVVDPDLKKRVRSLGKNIDVVDSLWQSINTNTIYSDEQQKITVTKLEKMLMDNVRDDIAGIKDAEVALLARREAESNKAISQAVSTLVVGNLLILLVVTLLIRTIIKEFTERLRAEGGLKDKITEVEQINLQTLEMNWLLSGIREINSSLIGNESLKMTIQNCLSRVVEYLQAPAGAFYFFDEEDELLQLMASVALPEHTDRTIKLKNGITGHAATLKEVSVITNVPAGYWNIGSATGAAVPNTIICVPLWQQNKLKGIIELASFGTVTRAGTELMKAVADNIAIAINGAYANERMYKLLYTVQEQKEEVESQQEELRKANEDLTKQTETLKSSEEELITQEEELRQINAELEEKTEAVEEASLALMHKASELEASSRYKSEFLANMSHELRTPLNSVLILANLLKDNKGGNLSDKQTEYAKIIHKSGTDLLNLINDILDLSKIEAGKVDMMLEDVKIKDIANDMDDLFMVLAGQKKVNFTIDIQTDIPPFINTDKMRLEQIIKNLLSNAFKFTPQDGKVILSFARHYDRLAISVTDSGIGIAPEKQQLIFEAFRQADGSTSRKFGGTGLGLSISKELVARLGGEITLSSNTGTGSTFTILMPFTSNITLPQAQAPGMPQAVEHAMLPQTAIVEQTAVPDDKSLLTPGAQPILIIEDDVVFATIVKEFANGKGYKTIVAASGNEGLYYARKYKPAAIILDLGLPVVDGRNVLRLLKADTQLKHIPVHVISSEDRGILPGDVHSYFQKPLKSNELELAFNSIGEYMHAKYKDLLIVSAASSGAATTFAAVAAERNYDVVIDIVQDVDQAKQKLSSKRYDCIIADVGSDMPTGIAVLKQLKASADTDTFIITLLDTDITSADERLIKPLADRIIRTSGQASSRLLDEVDLFLHKIKQSTAVTIPAGYDKNADRSLSGTKVLLADDDMRNVFAITAMLEEQGVIVIAAENGREALEMLDNNKDIDMVLMDIMMPEMDGYETIKHIRASKEHKRLPVIALTAKAMTSDREKCIEAGASDYITKPVDNNKLFSLMRVWLSQ